jgi:hypothetical protein
MPKAEYAAFKALDPFFKVVMHGLSGLVDAKHYFDTFADDAVYEFRYNFPGWPQTIRGRSNLMAAFSGYGRAFSFTWATALSSTLQEMLALSSSNMRYTERFSGLVRLMTTGSFRSSPLRTEGTCIGATIWIL